jgi:hypothetical protein
MRPCICEVAKSPIRGWIRFIFLEEKKPSPAFLSAHRCKQAGKQARPGTWRKEWKEGYQGRKEYRQGRKEQKGEMAD